MTISSVVPVNNYLGNGSTTTFDFDFLIENGSELVVTKTDSGGNIVTLVENLDYSVHETGNTSGSYITFPLASSGYSVLSSSEVLTLALDLDIKQESSFPTDIKLSLPVIERTFDYVVRLIQILSRKLDRAIKVKESPTIDTESLVNNIDKIGINLPSLININSNISNINAVNSNETNINTVSGIASDVSAVAGISSDISAVADNETNITAVNSNKTNIDTVAGISSDITTVAGISSDITAVKNNATDISTCAANISDINNAYTNAQSALTSANNALASENLAKDWANKMGSTVDGNEYSAKYYALQARDESAITFAQLNANLGYERTELLSDVHLYNDVYKYAHSSFDSTKFTVVGSPNITADGVASGFTLSNYLTLPYIYSDNVVNYTEKIKFTTGNDITTRQAIRGIGENVQKGIGITINNGGINYRIGTGTGWNQANSIHISANTTYTVEFTQTNTTSTFKLYSENDTLLDTKTATYTGLLYSQIVLGRNLIWDDSNFLGSIDLKQFSVTVDGYPVFSGNKTGTDTIIPNNYTVTGTPTISSNYMASGFSGANYIGIGGELDVTGKDFEISFSFITPSSITNNIRAILGGIDKPKTMNFILAGSNGVGRFGLASYNSHFGTFWTDYIITSTSARYYVKVGVEGNTVYFSYSTDKINWTTKTSTVITPFTSINEILGWTIDGTAYNGDVDLNSISIKIGGKVVYMARLAVPYTESAEKYGTKVVDSAYLDRVMAVYDYNGKAIYYVIDEANQKAMLPPGEIYGLMQKASDDKQVIGDWCVTEPTTDSTATLNKPAVVKENYLNGTDGYKVYSDGLIVQWGQGSTANNSCSFLKPFSDTNYCLLIRPNYNQSVGIASGYYYADKYTDRFEKTLDTVTMAFDWVAIGY
ncbi:hypothetical protein IKQ26_09720 [bacterium]|nr:hypothetical protein [bacterium]